MWWRLERPLQLLLSPSAQRRLLHSCLTQLLARGTRFVKGRVRHVMAAGEFEAAAVLGLAWLWWRTRNLHQKLRSLTSSLSAAKNCLQDKELEDDVILIDAFEPPESQELVLKIRCRADLYKVSVKTTDPLQRVIEHMAQTLKVHQDRILLLFRDRELAADATPHVLGLGVADIIDCVVETTSQGSSDAGNLQLRVQGKDKNSQMEITLQRGEPLQKLMSHYRQAQGFGRCKLAFYFDGQRLAGTCTPEELGMESGDVIEVWR